MRNCKSHSENFVNSFSLSDCTFNNVTTLQGNGGAIWVGGDSTVEDCSFVGCNAVDAGGLYKDGDGSFTMRNCSFVECFGKAANVTTLWISSSTDITFQLVRISGMGTAGKSFIRFVTENEQMNFQINDCHIDGGWCQFTDPTVQCIAFPATFGKIVISESSFKKINRQADGGGVFRFAAGESSIEFLECNFDTVKTSYNGGALSFVNPSEFKVTVFGCTFTNCSASQAGGAIYIAFGDAGTCNITNCNFDKNVASQTGRSISLNFLSAKPTTIESYVVANCTFSGHTGGRPLYLKAGTDDILGCTCELRELVFVGNSGFSEGLIGIWSSVSMKYVDCRFENNQPTTGGILVVCKGNCQECSFEGCHFEAQLTNSGMFSIGGGTLSRLQLSFCDFVSTTSTTAVLDLTGCTELHADGCSFTSCSSSVIKIGASTNNVFVNGSKFELVGESQGNYVIDTNSQTALREATIQYCQFWGENSQYECVINVNSQCPSLTVIHNSFGDNENRLASQALFVQDGTVENLKFEDNTCKFTSGLAKTSVELRYTSSLSLIGNSFELQAGTSSALLCVLPGPGQELTIDHCVFSNSDTSRVGGAKEFILFEQGFGGKLHFVDCDFQNIRSQSNGAGLSMPPSLSAGTDAWELYCTQCRFSRLVTEGNGGAIACNLMNILVIDDCTFQSCERGWSAFDGGGALWISDKTKSVTLIHSRFISNTSPENGASIHIQRDTGNLDALTIDNCTFRTSEVPNLQPLGVRCRKQCKDLRLSLCGQPA